ncbi:Holliday junction resolvase RuvX [bacterium]|nr:Holliday junction resolvase RuvX [bacterium]
MILPDFKAFPRVGRIMGIDWGARRTGVAVTDVSQEFFFTRPPIVVPRGGDAATMVADLARDAGAVAIVVGVPYRLDGSASDTTARVREFADALAGRVDVPIFLIDETLSSFAAQSDMGRVRRADIKEKLDSNAARVILENAVAMGRRCGAQ